MADKQIDKDREKTDKMLRSCGYVLSFS